MNHKNIIANLTQIHFTLCFVVCTDTILLPTLHLHHTLTLTFSSHTLPTTFTLHNSRHNLSRHHRPTHSQITLPSPIHPLGPLPFAPLSPLSRPTHTPTRLDSKDMSVMDLRRRYNNMYIPSDFFNVRLCWTEVLPLHRPLRLGAQTCSFHVRRRNVSGLPVFHGNSETTSTPTDASHLFSAKVDHPSPPLTSW